MLRNSPGAFIFVFLIEELSESNRKCSRALLELFRNLKLEFDLKANRKCSEALLMDLFTLSKDVVRKPLKENTVEISWSSFFKFHQILGRDPL